MGNWRVIRKIIKFFFLIFLGQSISFVCLIAVGGSQRSIEAETRFQTSLS